ncbi:peptidoglycan DD-metalloendopeptidase family protein [Aliiglaciecola sp. CAU 1673]|uniref:OapA family protein n=1 Tax=Aliiglaciecola sp. CAU 1673 TaxID=3032595 RepID=UPI0023DB99AB|nr:peptidoglycan DD-metalloendopeptidase family protein [Aliiglaciecola sp. CAU 1673]MDF2178520.1 peptidoglycan DD-metalloendopeptidase family protein [Aliiglaciecola sp. CAU 1673]
MVQKTIKQLPKPHKIMLASLMCLATVLLLLPSEPATASRQTEELELYKRYPLSIEVEEQDQQSADNLLNWKRFEVRKGDNLAKILSRAGLSPQDTFNVTNSGDEAKRLLKILPGEEIKVALDDEGALEILRYDYSPSETLNIVRQGEEGLISEIETRDVDIRFGYASGTIESSFWHAGMASGMSESQIMNLATIFGWDIDFALEIREGDSFNLVYEEQYIDGEFVGYGNILAAEFTNQGETFKAIRFEDGNYYTPEGRSMRKSFLRAPVNFKYISSNFTNARFHPVQKRWKAHRGIDYAASTGTPVIAAGDGKVIKSAYDQYNGHHVFLQHGERYQTKYLHFTKRTVKTGDTVKQGQVIGYVGATGLASGPHLHYEFLVDGVHRNPRTVPLPKAEPIDGADKTKFLAMAEEYQGHLDVNRRIMLAMNN